MPGQKCVYYHDIVQVAGSTAFVAALGSNRLSTVDLVVAIGVGVGKARHSEVERLCLRKRVAVCKIVKIDGLASVWI